MSEANRVISKCSDRAILSFFRQVEKQLNFQPMEIRLYGSSESIAYDQDEEIIKTINKSSSFAIESVSTHRRSSQPNASGASISFFRGSLTITAAGHHIVAPSLAVDTLKIIQNTIKSKEALLLNSLIEKELISKSAPSLDVESDNLNLRDLVTSHHQLINALHAQIVEVGEKYATSRIELENEVAERKKKLAEDSDDYLIQLKNEHAIQLSLLEEEKQKLAERQELLDDRDNTHVRREIRKQLKEQLASYRETFELTKGTRKLRRPVSVAVALVEVTCIGFLAYFLYSHPAESADIWARLYLWVKTFTLSFFAVGTIVWYLRWLTQWSNRHADAEFQLKQLELDVDRASWVVETAFEWKSSQETSIPEPLLAAISRNLFEVAGQRTEKEDSPLDHLASALLGEASRARIKLAGGHEVDFERKALKQAGQT